MTTQKKTTIGGQAIIEGIVMKGPKKSCTVVRKANGELVSKTEPTPSRAPIGKSRFPRRVYAVHRYEGGMQAINYSASFFEDEEADVPPSRFELWLEKKFGSEGLNKVILSISTVIGIALPIGLFILLPSFLGVCAENLGCARAQCARGLRARCAVPAVHVVGVAYEGYSPHVRVPRRRAQDHFLLRSRRRTDR